MPVDDAAVGALDPPQRRQRTLDAVKRLLLRESQVQPLLLVFEDLHWIDAETQALLDSLVESLPTARLAAPRELPPRVRARAGAARPTTPQLRLDPLPPESAEELLHALCSATTPASQPLKRLLIERTEGNPFFLEESVRTLVETGVLTGERGAYRLAQAAGEPRRCRRRCRRCWRRASTGCRPRTSALLQTAAVIGKDVPYALLQAIADLPEHAAPQGLRRLQAAEFLYETSLFPELEYTFKHALTHEVAYGSLLSERRRALHARIVAGDRDAVRRPAGRARRAARAPRAARRGVGQGRRPICRQAGDKAAARSAYREAREQFEQALGALGHLPRRPRPLRAGDRPATRYA